MDPKKMPQNPTAMSVAAAVVPSPAAAQNEQTAWGEQTLKRLQERRTTYREGEHPTDESILKDMNDFITSAKKDLIKITTDLKSLIEIRSNINIMREDTYQKKVYLYSTRILSTDPEYFKKLRKVHSLRKRIDGLTKHITEIDELTKHITEIEEDIHKMKDDAHLWGGTRKRGRRRTRRKAARNNNNNNKRTRTRARTRTRNNNNKRTRTRMRGGIGTLE